MQKMMTYSEANSVLGSSLTPANRCLSKAVAIANDADPDLLANFDNARLVPASVVEPAAHAEVLHFFCDENGNNLGTDYTINVLEGQGAFVVYTRILVNGETPNISWFRQKDWSKIPQTGNHDWYPQPEQVDYTGSMYDGFCYPGELDSRGILRHVIYAPKKDGKFISKDGNIAILWDDSAKKAGIDVNNYNRITLYINPTSHPGYNISRTILFFRDKDLGYGQSVTINGFNNFTVTRVSKDYKTFSDTGEDINTSDWFSDFAVRGNKLIVYRNTNHLKTRSYNFEDVYKISDGNKILYLRVSDGSYNSSYVQPGQEGDSDYKLHRVRIDKTETQPDPSSNASFFQISAPDGKCSIDTSSAGCYITFLTQNGAVCPCKGRILAVNPNNMQIIGRTNWFYVEDDTSNQRDYYLHNNILKNSEVVSFINTNVSNRTYLFLEAEINTKLTPERISIEDIQPNDQ